MKDNYNKGSIVSLTLIVDDDVIHVKHVAYVTLLVCRSMSDVKSFARQELNTLAVHQLIKIYIFVKKTIRGDTRAFGR